MDVNAIDLVGAAGDRRQRHGLRGRRRPRTSSGYAAPRPPSPTGPRRRSRHDDRLPGDQDGLAPDRHLLSAGTSSAARRRAGGRERSVRVRARVIVLAGPSGAGKSRLAERHRAPGAAPRRLLQGRRRPDAAEDHRGPERRASPTGTTRRPGCSTTRSTPWSRSVATARPTCRSTRSRRTAGAAGRCSTWPGSPYFLAEGIFAQEVVPPLAERGLLAAAYCVTQHPVVTFWRRLTRDLREHRKPPLVLVRRGLALLRDQRRVVAHAEALGCRVATPEEAYRRDQETDVSGRVGRPAAGGAPAAARPALVRRERAGDGARAARRGLRALAGRGCRPVPRGVARDPRSHHRPGDRGRPPADPLAARARHPAVGGRQRAERGDAAAPGSRSSPSRAVRPSTRSSSAVAAGTPSPLYVGSRWLPRHVVLVVDVGGRLPAVLRAQQRPGAHRDRATPSWTRRSAWPAGTKPWCIVVPR